MQILALSFIYSPLWRLLAWIGARFQAFSLGQLASLYRLNYYHNFTCTTELHVVGISISIWNLMVTSFRQHRSPPVANRVPTKI